MPRVLLALLFFSFISGKAAFAQIKGSFLVYENDTINRVDENGMKTGKWVYFFRDTTLDVHTTFIYDCYKADNGSAHCVSTIKHDTTYRNYANEVRARGNYVQNLREGLWMIGENDVYNRHAEIIFSHDTVSRLFPVLLYDNEHCFSGSIIFSNNNWSFCYKNNGVWKENPYYTNIDQFLTDAFIYDRINFPAKFTVR